VKNGNFGHIFMSTTDHTILGLKLPSDPRWVNLAEMSLEDILTDHAYCEQKAASHCISLIQKYPQYTELVDALSPIVTEEWGHFRMVIAEIKKRGLTLGPQRKDDYVNALNQLETKGGRPEIRFMDRLLIFGLIEARSCERFRLLSEKLEDPYLREFYRKFMVSEAGHYRLFLDLAKTYCDAELVTKRWQELLQQEREILNAMEVRGDRIH
jgi:tRNA-(ms[2]io[6]A)-hydroxylase